MEEQVNKIVCLGNETARNVECQNDNDNNGKKIIKGMTLKAGLDYTNHYCFLNGIKTKS